MTMIPHSKPAIGPEDIRAVTEVLRSGQVAGGPAVAQFERGMADYLGLQGGAAVSSVRELGRVLFDRHAFAFEATSILILVAMVGAVVLARREDQS